MIDEIKLKHLYNLLDKAKTISAEYKGGYSNTFFSAEDFHSTLIESIIKLKTGDYSQINSLWNWFAPTSSWDDFIHLDGIVLGNEIFELLDELNK